jgi:serine/threonine-protein kinase RsbW
MSEVNPIRQVVLASPAGIRQAIDEFGRFSRARQLPDSLRRRFQVALDELLSNVARHARPKGGEIQVSFEMMGVTIEDHSEPFNPLDAPPPDTASALQDRKPGGVGIAIVRGLMEEVGYERVDGRNRLTLVDRVSRPVEQT